MRILGVDPGVTTGWVIFDTATRTVTDSGEFPDYHITLTSDADVCVVEKPVGQGPTRPTMVENGITSGIIWERLSYGDNLAKWITRLDVKKTLSEATYREPVVVNDTTVRAAMKVLFGADAFKKGQPLYGVTGTHRLAALAVCVAWDLQQQKAKA